MGTLVLFSGDRLSLSCPGWPRTPGPSDPPAAATQVSCAVAPDLRDMGQLLTCTTWNQPQLPTKMCQCRWLWLYKFWLQNTFAWKSFQETGVVVPHIRAGAALAEGPIQFKHAGYGSQPSVTPILGDLMPSSNIWGHQNETYTYM